MDEFRNNSSLSGSLNSSGNSVADDDEDIDWAVDKEDDTLSTSPKVRTFCSKTFF
jgi:hypothetical protein